MASGLVTIATFGAGLIAVIAMSGVVDIAVGRREGFRGQIRDSMYS